MHPPLTSEQINQLRSFDTCVISDAIESFGVRLRNEGFATAGFRCLFKNFPPMVGYAATCKVRSADPPIVGSRYEERTDWWKHIGRMSAPRVLVMQDIDNLPGTGAFLGKVHTNILMALGCVGAVTNGAARELPGIEASGFQVFAGRLGISRAYIHVVEYGGPVEVGNLTIQPGDLIHGDRHGIITVPQHLVPLLPAAARVIAEKKQQLIDLSRKAGTTHAEFSQGLRDLLDFNPNSLRDGAKQWKR
ncbi:MAG: RraA family protein [Terriglobia bacterium]